MTTRVEIVLAALGIKVAEVRGRRAWCLCVFHQEADAPISEATRFFVRIVGDRVGNFYCFSCKASGSLVALVARVRGLDDPKAAKAWIEEAAKGYRAPRLRARVVARPAVLSRPGFSIPEGVIYEPLDRWVSVAREYARGRGLEPDDLERWGIGYAVDGYLGGRIVFPFRDARGRVVSYSARTFVDDEPRFRTPREGDGQDDDAILGEHLWPPLAERKTAAVVVIEGPFDVVSTKRLVPEANVAGLGGSDVRPGHVVSLATFGRVVAMTDPDPPGEKAASVLRSSLGRHVEFVRARLPPGRDATLLAAGDEAKGIRADPELLRRKIRIALGASASI